MNIERITWVDAHTTDGWEDDSFVPGVETVYSIGVVVHEDENSVTIAGTYAEGQHNNRITIPSPLIVGRTILGTV